MTKAITVTQPFASLIAAGVKRYETRSWSTRYRGPLLIHSAKGVWGPDAARYAVSLRRAGLLPRTLLSDLPRGAIIAIAELVDVLPSDVVPPAELFTGPWAPAAYAWRFGWVLPVEPMPWRGRLSLWDGPDAASLSNVGKLIVDIDRRAIAS